MFASIKLNLFLAPLISLLIISSYARFHLTTTQDDIKAICSKAKDSSFCLKFLNSKPEIKPLDLPGLAKYLINYASQSSVKTQKDLQSLAKSSSDVHVKGVYNSCVENYNNALSDFASALKALAAKDHASVNIGVSGAMTQGDTCSSDLSSIKASQALLTEISDVENVSGIVLVISNMIPKKIDDVYD